MSAFAVLYERSNSPVNAAILQTMRERLAYRGPDGWDSISMPRLAMGHAHFWTTPEEVGERQPLHLADLPYCIVLDGRVDNREHLIAALGPSRDHIQSSDATLILYAYAKWGENCFEHLVGDYALVIYDELEERLVCARDALGDRTLFYCFHGSQVVIASEPWAVAAIQPKVGLDAEGLTYYFSLQAPPDGQTLFKDIRELLPAQVMTIQPSGENKRYFWMPDPTHRTRFKRDEEYANQFRELLEQSIRARVRSTNPTGVMMSGGLDSTSVACLAARMISAAPLTTLSFIFNDDELKDCDEQIYINAVQKKWGTRSIQIPCDDAWPFKDWDQWPRVQNAPDGNIFRLAKERLYARAREEGIRVLLTGGFADQLYGGGADWLADLIREGNLLGTLRGLAALVRQKGWSRALLTEQLSHTARSLLKTALPKVLVGKIRLAPKPPLWLTPEATRLWIHERLRFHPSFERHQNILGLQTAQSSSLEIYYAGRHRIELRHPYRDQRLVEYILSIPAYQLYYGGLYKHILRVAMQGILPETIRTRANPTRLLSLYQRGLQREASLIQSSLAEPNAFWKNYVLPDWLRANWKNSAFSEEVGVESLIAWLCISFESWYKWGIDPQLS